MNILPLLSVCLSVFTLYLSLSLSPFPSHPRKQTTYYHREKRYDCQQQTRTLAASEDFSRSTVEGTSYLASTLCRSEGKIQITHGEHLSTADICSCFRSQMYFYEFYIVVERRNLFSARDRIRSIQYICYFRILTHYGFKITFFKGQCLTPNAIRTMVACQKRSFQATIVQTKAVRAAREIKEVSRSSLQYKLTKLNKATSVICHIWSLECFTSI